MAGNAPLLPLENLAAEYSRWREEAERRLSGCAAMLVKGSEHTALEMAEAEPPLLDLVAALSFAEEPEWSAYCSAQGLSTGPALDPRAIGALDAVYAKGISPNSPLYHEYRAAITSRDDEKALQTIRTISRVNPSDANAQSELERLLNKLMHARLEALRAALEAGADEKAVQLVDELEKSAPAARLVNHPDFVRGLVLRKRVRLASAARELPSQLEEIGRLQQAGDWQRAAERLHLLEEQQEDLGLALDEGQQARCEAVKSFIEAGRTDAKEQARFMRAVGALRAQGEQAATRSAGASTLGLKEAEELEAKFDQLEHEVKQFKRPVPEPAAGSIRASAKAVRGAAGRIRRRRLLKRAALVGLVVLGIGSGLAWFGRRTLVKRYSEELAALQASGQVLAAQELLQQVQKSNLLGIHSAPELQTALAGTGHWVAGQIELRTQSEAQVAALEKEPLAEGDPAVLHGKLSGVEDEVRKLAPDLAPALESRLTVVRRSMETHFTKLRAEREPGLRAALAEAQAKLAPVNYDMPASEAKAVLDQVRSSMEKLEQQVRHPAPSLRPVEDVMSGFEELAKKSGDFRKDLETVSSSQAQMRAASSLEEYQSALKALAGARYREVAVAQPVLNSFPSTDRVAARLLMDGDLSDWKAVCNDRGTGAAMRPLDVRQEEIGIILALRDDPNLANVWQWTLTSGGDTRSGWSQSKPREYIVGGEKRYEGSLWDPVDKDITPIFRQVKLPSYGGPVNVKGIALSSTSQVLASVKLEQLTNAAGDQWTASLLDTLTQIAKSRMGATMSRAILMQQLGAITALRPHDWGRHYCPSLRRDLAQLESICGRRLNTHEWMLPSTISLLGPKIAVFFQEVADRDYLVEARRFREVALALRDAGVHYAGFVDAGEAAHITDAARSATELWCALPDKMLLLKVEPGAPNAGLGAQLKECPAYAPLFHVPVGRESLLRLLNGVHDNVPFLSRS